MHEKEIVSHVNIPRLKRLVKRKFGGVPMFAEAIGVKPLTVYRWYARECVPRLANLEKASEALSISTSEILDAPGKHIYENVLNMIYDFFEDTERNIETEPFDAKRAKVVVELAERLGYLDTADADSQDTGEITQEDLETYERVKAQLASDVMLP